MTKFIMSRTVNIHEAKTHLSKLVEQVRSGEEIILAKAGKPCARLVPLDSPSKATRIFGGIVPSLTESEVNESLSPLDEDDLDLWTS